MELAFCLPVVVLLLAVLVQTGIVVTDQVRVWHAAREAARVAAVDPDLGHVRSAAEAGGLHPVDVNASPSERFRIQGEPIRVQVEYSATRRLPLVGSFIGAQVLTATATMRIETP